MNARTLLCWTITLASVWLWSLVAHGQSTSDRPLATDTCVLDLKLPAGATVKIDGRDYGAKRTLTYSRLKPGQIYPANVDIRFGDGQQLQRRVWIQGGRRIVLPREVQELPYPPNEVRLMLWQR